MKVVILAGGLGTRISEESVARPKPMIEIGSRPILWHIMKSYSHYGINDFIICLGYKGYLIKEYFANYSLHMSDLTVKMKDKTSIIHNDRSEAWNVTLVDTGINTSTGGRLKRIAEFIKDDSTFCMTYGDGLSDLNIKNLIAYHYSHGKQATVTAVRPPGRYGALKLEDAKVKGFLEKPDGDGGLINGGFFVLSTQVLRYIENDMTSWESDALEKLVLNDQLMAFNHDGFWQPMDTLREKNYLEDLWNSHNAPWRVWGDFDD
jgi:glucose-1-phosphate cytidylyltransferase